MGFVVWVSSAHPSNQNPDVCLYASSALLCFWLSARSCGQCSLLMFLKLSLLFIDDSRLTKQRPKEVNGMLIYYSFPFN